MVSDILEPALMPEPPLYFLVTCSLRGGIPNCIWLAAGCSRLCPLPHSHSPKAQATQSGDRGGQRDEEFRLGCTFLPCLWGGQQRNPVSPEQEVGGETAAFVLPLESLGEHTALFLGPGPSKRALEHQQTPVSD